MSPKLDCGSKRGRATADVRRFYLKAFQPATRAKRKPPDPDILLYSKLYDGVSFFVFKSCSVPTFFKSFRSRHFSSQFLSVPTTFSSDQFSYQGYTFSFVFEASAYPTFFKLVFIVRPLSCIYVRVVQF